MYFLVGLWIIVGGGCLVVWGLEFCCARALGVGCFVWWCLGLLCACLGVTCYFLRLCGVYVPDCVVLGFWVCVVGWIGWVGCFGDFLRSGSWVGVVLFCCLRVDALVGCGLDVWRWFGVWWLGCLFSGCLLRLLV